MLDCPASITTTFRAGELTWDELGKDVTPDELTLEEEELELKLTFGELGELGELEEDELTLEEALAIT